MRRVIRAACETPAKQQQDDQSDDAGRGVQKLLGAQDGLRGKSFRPKSGQSPAWFHREGAALRVGGVYDKHRLVPFGEFLPLGDLAGRLGIRSLVHMPEDFTPGPPPRPMRLEGVPAVQPLICYEALFPGLAVRGARPAWILNVSNDAWFGATSGPWQHLNIASYRAIEQGLPIIRATPTGVSAVIDAQGRILPGKSLGLGTTGVIDARLPSPAAATLYSQVGDWPFGGLLVASAGAFLAGRRRRVRQSPEQGHSPALGAT